MDRERERDRERGDRGRDRRLVQDVPVSLPTSISVDQLSARTRSLSVSERGSPSVDRPRRDDRYSNTYRPRSPPPRADTYRHARSPPRSRLMGADTYTPGGRAGGRPRSRSPAYRRRSRSPRRDDRDGWRARPRSPPRRAFSPRRDDFRERERPRSPRRDYDSYTTRSPRPCERSPPSRIRDREPSPARSPPPRVRRTSPMIRDGRFDEPQTRSRPHRYVIYTISTLHAHFSN